MVLSFMLAAAARESQLPPPLSYLQTSILSVRSSVHDTLHYEKNLL